MNVLVYSIAQNGYAYRYRGCLRSQREYCETHGYAYVAVTRPWRVADAALSAWLKLPLMQSALAGGYDVVMFLDADCRVRDAAPGLSGFASAEHGILMARGWSGRLNSGVIVARRGPDAMRFLGHAMASLTEEVPDDARAHLRYENANLIHCARVFGGVGVLDGRWNSMQRPAADDYVRHYTGGMKRAYRPPPLGRALTRAVALTTARTRTQPARRSPEFRARLERLTAEVLERYPRISQVASE